MRHKITVQRSNVVHSRHAIMKENIKNPNLLLVRKTYVKYKNIKDTQSKEKDSSKRVVREFESSEDNMSEETNNDIDRLDRSNSTDTLKDFKLYDPILNTDKDPLKTGNNRFLYVENKRNIPPVLKFNKWKDGDKGVVHFKENRFLIRSCDRKRAFMKEDENGNLKVINSNLYIDIDLTNEEENYIEAQRKIYYQRYFILLWDIYNIIIGSK